MKRNPLLFIILYIFIFKVAVGQENNHILLTTDSLFQLAEKNSKQLNASRQKIDISRQNSAIEMQEAYLPDLDAGASAGYISNAHVWDNHFNYMETVKMPHTALDFSVEASYTVFNGGKTKNLLAKAKLEEQIAALDYQKDKEDIQFLLLARYLDLFTLYNRRKIYRQNILLAEKRLADIRKLVEQGMLTHNDIVRSELQLTDLKLQLTEINNDAEIANHELAVVIGLPENTVIDVDTTLYHKTLEADNIKTYVDSNHTRIPEILAAIQKTKLAEKDINIEKGSRLPVLSLYGTDLLARPFLYSIPPMDIYMHYAQVGVKLSYDIGSLYKSKKRIEKAKMNYHLAQMQEDWLKQKSAIGLHNACIKVKEAGEKYRSQEKSYELAKDNYRVIEQKYLNKFAVITDMLDASTSLLASQLNLNNARIGIIYQWFNLMKVSGNWEVK